MIRGLHGILDFRRDIIPTSGEFIFRSLIPNTSTFNEDFSAGNLGDTGNVSLWTGNWFFTSGAEIIGDLSSRMAEIQPGSEIEMLFDIPITNPNNIAIGLASSDFFYLINVSVSYDGGTSFQSLTTFDPFNTSFIFSAPPGVLGMRFKFTNPGLANVTIDDVFIQQSAGDIIIPTNPAYTGQYNYNVSWEEVGNPANNGSLVNQTGDATISPGANGTYIVKISGDFPAIYFNNGPESTKLIQIDQWGNIVWQSMENAFAGCSNLSGYIATDTPNLSSVTGMGGMFAGAVQFNGDISGWDVSNVTDMSEMFNGAITFDRDIDGWIVSNVTDMNSMFRGAIAFNRDLNNWDVSIVTDMSQMFFNATNFNGNIKQWVVSSVTDMSEMFNGAQNFDQLIGTWDVSSVTDMGSMFLNAKSFNQDLSGWCVANIPSLPAGFDTGADFWIGGTATRPQWGTCP